MSNPTAPVARFRTATKTDCLCCGLPTSRRVKGLPVCNREEGACALMLEGEFGADWVLSCQGATYE